MRSILRRNALAVCLLGVAFIFQFQAAKHWTPWSAVSPFSDDPYDAVGSFAVQFVLFMMIVSLVRAFRASSDPAQPVAAFTRGAVMTSVAIAFTCLADLVAMARHLPAWLGRPQGTQLLAATALLLFWSVSAAAWFLLSTRDARSPGRLDGRKLAVPAAALLLLGVYPETLRVSVTGAVLTALLGSVLLFVAIWSVGTALLPVAKPSDTGPANNAPLPPGGARTQKRFDWPPWLDPQRLGWALAAVIGLACGALLVTQELAQPGPSPHGSRRILVIVVYLFLESAGVLMGYALLARPLRFLPRD